MPIRMREDLVQKGIRIQGISHIEPPHLSEAVHMLLDADHDFARLITHHFALEQVQDALVALGKGEAMKAALLPNLGTPPKKKHRLLRKPSRTREVEA
jgi:threonine dehydrogenase-like Zn-dependent dehydrogenase